MTIKNEKELTDERTELLRDMIEHRAAWYYFLIDEAEKQGLKEAEFAREAIRRCGCFHGEEKLVDTDNLEEFAADFLSEDVRNIFEMEIDVDQEKLIVDFNYCPLVNSWLKLTDDEDAIDTYCDIAMEGDRGIVSTYDNFEYELQKTIASGDDHCRLVITKKEK